MQQKVTKFFVALLDKYFLKLHNSVSGKKESEIWHPLLMFKLYCFNATNWEVVWHIVWHFLI